jgi:hypothetical protein
MQLARVFATFAVTSVLCACSNRGGPDTLATVISSPTQGSMTITAPATSTAGACQQAQARFLDGSGGALRLPSNTSIALQGGNGVRFFSDAACSPGGQVSSVTAPAGATTVSFFFAGTVAGSTTIQASGTLSSGSAPSQATSPLVISPGPAQSLAFAAGGPTTGIAGVALSPALTVSAFDSFGNLATSSSGTVTLSAFTDPACKTAGTGSLTNATASLGSGSAQLSGVQYTVSGPLYLSASLGGATVSPCSSAVTIAPGAAAALAFKSYPGATLTAGMNVTASVAVQDSFGNLVNTSAAPVSIATAAGTLATQAAAAGLASFSIGTLTAAGTYTLTATSTGLTSAVGTPFTIVTGGVSAANSSLKASVASAPVGATITLTATLRDAFNNPIAGVPVTLARSGASAATLTQPAAPTDASGNASGSITSTAFGAQQLSIQAPAGLSGVTAQVTFTDAALSFSNASPVSFGSVNLGASADQTIQVAYAGNVAAAVSGGAATIMAIGMGTGFSFKGGSYPGTGGTCAAQIQANCTLVVTFTPVAAGPATENLVLAYTPAGASTPKSATISLTGKSMTGVVQLAWAAYPGEQDGFLIEHSLDNVTFTQILQLPATAGAATVSGLSTGQTHYFRIRSFNGAGDSPYAATVSAAIP